jgi:hypothetical protein
MTLEAKPIRILLHSVLPSGSEAIFHSARINFGALPRRKTHHRYSLSAYPGKACQQDFPELIRCWVVVPRVLGSSASCIDEYLCFRLTCSTINLSQPKRQRSPRYGNMYEAATGISYSTWSGY